MKIWIDLANPSHTLFFNSLINELMGYNIIVTIRDRAETIDLAELFGLQGKIIGKDDDSRINKVINVFLRTFELYLKVNKFDCALSFENGISVSVGKLRRKKTILFCDNDLKFIQRKSYFQDIETKIKTKADNIIIPQACYKTFKTFISEKKLHTYDGYKEDVYLAEYTPDLNFNNNIPFKDFIVIRPEALGSLYVKKNQSIVPKLLELFKRESVNIVYLPRDKTDNNYSKDYNVIVPSKALNGLDLCFYSNAVLTGSGTMSREAACMGRTSISFFPSDILLSVDQQLIDEGKIFHSRDPKEIVEYVISNYRKKREINIERNKCVKKEVLKIITECLNEEIT